MSQAMSDVLNALSDAELSEELHRRRTANRKNRDAELVRFSEMLIVVLNEFEKISDGKQIVRGVYGGYKVEEKK